MGACGYRFGLSDQTQYLSHYVTLRWPGSLDGDPYLDAFSALGSFLWVLLAPIPQALLPLAAAAMTVLLAMMSVFILMALGASLSDERKRGWGAALAGAVPPMTLVIPKEQNYFGLVSLADVELTATVAVLPLVFGSMAMFVRGRLLGSLALGLIAVPIHGQTAAYILAAWCAGVMLCDWRNTRRLVLVGAVLAGGLVGVAMALRVGPVETASLDAYERLGRELYAPLIDLWSIPWRSWLALVMVLAFGACAIPLFLRRGSTLPAPARSARERLVLYGIASLAFPLLGAVLLGAGLKEPLLWRLMIPRSLMLVQIASVVIGAVWAMDRLRLGGRDGLIGLSLLLGLIAWPAPYSGVVVTGALRAVGLSVNEHTAGHVVAGVLGALILALVVGTSIARPRTGGAVGNRLPVPTLSVALVVVVLAGLLGRLASGYAWLRDSTPTRWREAQLWAREHSPEGSVFVTPPYLAGWRIGSHRPTYGELRDGGLLFYAGQPALEWERRMALLRMDSMRAWWWDVEPGTSDAEHAPLREQYHAALRERFDEIAQGAAYVVVEGPPDDVWGEAVWTNGAFTIVEPTTLP